MKRGLFRNIQGTEQADTQSMFPTGVERRASGSRKSLCPSFAPMTDTSRLLGASKGGSTERVAFRPQNERRGSCQGAGCVARAGLRHVHHGAPTAAFTYFIFYLFYFLVMIFLSFFFNFYFYFISLYSTGAFKEQPKTCILIYYPYFKMLAANIAF